MTDDDRFSVDAVVESGVSVFDKGITLHESIRHAQAQAVAAVLEELEAERARFDEFGDWASEGCAVILHMDVIAERWGIK